MVKQFQKVTAYYKPIDESDLTEEAKQHIGQMLGFQYAWLMDEDDRWPGVWALLPINASMGWVPEFDLEIIYQ